MIENGFLNPDIAYLITKIRHGDELLIIDAGFPAPKEVQTVNISYGENKPTIDQFLEELLKYFSVEKIVMSNETKEISTSKFNKIAGMFDKNVKVEIIPNAELKERSKNVYAIIRTGDFTAYSNVLLVSSGGNRWYFEN
jgi:D-ribose pyranase